MDVLKEWIHDFLSSWGWERETVGLIEETILLLFIFLIAFIAYFICKNYFIKGVLKITRKTKAQWDDYVFNEKILRNFCHIVPAVIITAFIPLTFTYNSVVQSFIFKLSMVYLIAVSLRFVNSFLSVIFGLFDQQANFKGRSLKGILQVVQIVVIFIAIILIISVLIGKSPVNLLAGLGASAAILTLVFKDSLMGLVSGVQLSANDMLRPGDWITMPKYNADGVVVDVTLHTVKVRNFDNTITTIPPYSLVTDSFQNWRGMSESKGRRVKRSINIDMNTVKFCTPEMLEKYRKIGLLKDYIESREEEIRLYNTEHNIDGSLLINGRHQTNLGVFRAYLEAYIKNHPEISKELIAMVRQLQPTEKGIPLELYFFSSEKRWVYYENIQSDVFDHVLAVVPIFDLKVFQNPSGADFREIGKNC